MKGKKRLEEEILRFHRFSTSFLSETSVPTVHSGNAYILNSFCRRNADNELSGYMAD